MRKAWLVSFILCVSLFCNAESTKYSDMDWIIQLGYGMANTKVRHSTESSSLSGFTALNGESSVKNNSYTITIIKEFLSENRFSISMNGFFGFLNGSGDGTESSVNYREEVSGNHFGLGLSANLNYSGYNMKIQPYLGFDFLIENTNYEMDYTVSATPIKTKYEYSGKFADISLGIRLLDPSVELMSFLSLSYLQPISEEQSATAVIGGSEGGVVHGLVIKSAMKVSIGFGFVF